MPQVLYSGPRDELRWEGLTFRRNETTDVPDARNARRLASFDGFVIVPEQAHKGGWPKGKPRKPDVQNL